MRNDVERDDNLAEAPPTTLVILASDEDAVCVDDLCLPADARVESDKPEATAR